MAPNGSITKSWSAADSKKAKSERASAGLRIDTPQPAGAAASEEAAIGHHARIYLQRPGTKVAVDLGQKDLDVRPIRFGRAQFEDNGRTEVGQIEQIPHGVVGGRSRCFERKPASLSSQFRRH